MTHVIIFFAIAAAVVVALVILHYRKRSRRREALMRRPLPPEWQRDFDRVALTARLPEALRKELEGRTQIFLDEKYFEGAGGLEVTDAMRVTVAALASLLLLNKKCDCYPKLRSVLIYPDAYVAPDRSYAGGGAEIVGEDTRLGESWNNGTVVLAWRESRLEARDPKSRRNVVLHEFAHQLDALDGVADGMPPLPGGMPVREWHETMEKVYRQLCDEVHHAVHEVIDWYGATNPAEFFAVTTESFFCEPLRLRDAHPELYSEFVRFYRLVPAAWR